METDGNRWIQLSQGAVPTGTGERKPTEIFLIMEKYSKNDIMARLY
jgi:hypothetical protein